MERAKVISGRYFEAWNTADLELVENNSTKTQGVRWLLFSTS